jgi:phosphoglycolate phosphatase-like HAD superfamily hydrolase
VLKTLKKRKYLLGISSGTIETIITQYLTNLQFDLVNDILGFRYDFQKGKDHFDFVKKKHSLHSSQILFIGDSLNDAKRAKDNQIDFIARSGMFDLENFAEIIPKCRMIDELSELLDFL